VTAYAPLWPGGGLEELATRDARGRPAASSFVISRQ